MAPVGPTAPVATRRACAIVGAAHSKQIATPRLMQKWLIAAHSAWTWAPCRPDTVGHVSSCSGSSFRPHLGSWTSVLQQPRSRSLAQRPSAEADAALQTSLGLGMSDERSQGEGATAAQRLGEQELFGRIKVSSSGTSRPCSGERAERGIRRKSKEISNTPRNSDPPSKPPSNPSSKPPSRPLSGQQPRAAAPSSAPPTKPPSRVSSGQSSSQPRAAPPSSEETSSTAPRPRPPRPKSAKKGGRTKNPKPPSKDLWKEVTARLTAAPANVAAGSGARAVRSATAKRPAARLTIPPKKHGFGGVVEVRPATATGPGMRVGFASRLHAHQAAAMKSGADDDDSEEQVLWRREGAAGPSSRPATATGPGKRPTSASGMRVGFASQLHAHLAAATEADDDDEEEDQVLWRREPDGETYESEELRAEEEEVLKDELAGPILPTKSTASALAAPTTTPAARDTPKEQTLATKSTASAAPPATPTARDAPKEQTLATKSTASAAPPPATLVAAREAPKNDGKKVTRFDAGR